MAITVTHPTIEEVFKDFYSIPAFQREYVWQEEHVEALLEDAFEALLMKQENPLTQNILLAASLLTKNQTSFNLLTGNNESQRFI